MTQDTRHVLETTLQRQLHWIGAADGKIGPVLAVDTAMLGVLSAFAPPGGQWTVPLALLTACAMLAVGASFIHLFSAAFPRTEGPAKSLVYFGGITERTEEEFLAEILQLDAPSYNGDLARQCYRNAEIAGLKFAHVRTATLLMFWGLVPWVLAVYLMYPFGR